MAATSSSSFLWNNGHYRPHRHQHHQRPGAITAMSLSTTDSTTGGIPFPTSSFNNTNGEIMSSSSSTTTTTTSTTSTTINATTSSQNDTTTTTPTTTTPSMDAANPILAIDPADIEIVTLEEPMFDDDEEEESLNGSSPDSTTTATTPTDMDLFLKNLPFVSMFRGSANYIANHRNTIAVYHIPGALLESNGTVFRDLMNDVALTWLLGMRIVLVAGCKHQIEKRTGKQERHHGLRVTDEATLRIVKEEAGYVRFEIERQLARSLRMQGAGMSSTGSSKTNKASTTNLNKGNTIGGGARAPSMTGFDGNVVSGNFYSAQPYGILDGTDYKYTGFVRRVEVEKIKRLHDSRDICLLTPLGVSPSGEVFNVNSESLAATVAGAVGASKVVYFTERETDLRHKIHENKIQSLRKTDAINLLKYHQITMHRKGFVTLGDHAKATLCNTDDKNRKNQNTLDMLLKIGWCTEAISMGVKRAHIISPKHGALLQELYTRDGSGTLISADLYEGIRRADYTDVAGIHDLISPLIRAGTLIDRPKAQLEKDIQTYYVYTRDNSIVACGQLKQFENGFAEIGCLVVNPEFRSRGRGDAMLGYLERLCLLNQCTSVFVLSTQTMEWFVERGFQPVTVDALPPSRQATYNHKRASKIYMKEITSDRDLDASELWWNR